MPSSTSFAEVVPPPFVGIGVIIEHEPRTGWLIVKTRNGALYRLQARENTISRNSLFSFRDGFGLLRQGRGIEFTQHEIEVGDMLIHYNKLIKLELPALPPPIHEYWPKGWFLAIRVGRIQPRWRS